MPFRTARLASLSIVFAAGACQPVAPYSSVRSTIVPVIVVAHAGDTAPIHVRVRVRDGSGGEDETESSMTTLAPQSVYVTPTPNVAQYESYGMPSRPVEPQPVYIAPSGNVPIYGPYATQPSPPAVTTSPERTPWYE